jgi:hypothetical protein
MSSESGGNDGWAYSEAKDWKDGRHRRENKYVLSHAGEVRDRDTRQWLTVVEQAYARMYRDGRLSGDAPGDAKDLNQYQGIRQKHDTEAFSKRVESGDEGGIRSHVGSQSDEVDVSGWHDIETIREVATDRHLRLYEFGEPGTGKTSAGCLMARHWLMGRLENGRPDAIVFTNIRSLASEEAAGEDRGHIRYVGSWGALLDELERIDDTDRPFLFLFDEASSQASGGGKSGHQAGTKLATLVYKIRKYAGGGALIIIGHDGKDVHPAIRLLCTVMEKDSKKKARFYNTVRNRSGKEPLTPEITGWPDSKWSPNDKDPAPWNWSKDRDEESGESGGDITRESAYREMAVWTVIRSKSGDELSNREIAEERLNGAYSEEWVRQRWNEYEDGKHGETMDRVQEAIA